MTRCPESAELLVLGIGNTLLSDEGAGVHAVRQLARDSNGDSNGDAGLRFLDGGTLGLALTSEIAACDALIVIDAAELGRPAGSVAPFEGPAMDAFLSRSAAQSVHAAGLRDLMAAVALAGRLPSRRALIAIQPATLQWGMQTSDVVTSAIDQACTLVRETIGRWTMQKRVIPIVPSITEGSGAGAMALLHELAQRLEWLVHEGEDSCIDLTALPLTPEDYRQLREALGAGAVVAEVQAGGATQVRETACPGVWWITHSDERGAVLAEAIEVCAIPAILCAPREDMSAGLARLEGLLQSMGRRPARKTSEEAAAPAAISMRPEIRERGASPVSQSLHG